MEVHFKKLISALGQSLYDVIKILNVHVFKKSEIMLSEATWMGLGVIILSKVSEKKVIII